MIQGTVYFLSLVSTKKFREYS